LIISRTPFRISFFGGGTDYPNWYRKHGGEALATTINKYCYLTCRYLPPFFEHNIKIVYSKIECCHTIDEIKHPAVREVLRYLEMDRGVEIHHDGDLPARSGMGSSSAFTVGLLHALYALRGYMPGKAQLARESIHIEQERLKETVGCQDQVLAAYGGLNHVVFAPDDQISVRPVTLPRDRIQELNDHLMLFFTGIHRTASRVARRYVPDILVREKPLLAIKDMVQKSLSILNDNQDIDKLGELLHKGWEIKRSLSPGISNTRVDDIYRQALDAGAIGGKLLGAGGGGFILLFAAPSRQKKIRETLQKLTHVPFKFESSGSQIIFYDPQEDYSAHPF
jgi:D-glycero-alpha-D-manno-heptose-7-phosphate kinase